MTPRRKKAIVAGAIGLTAIVAVATIGELVARTELENRAAAFAGTLPGVTTALAGGPALGQLAGGRIDIELSVSDAALTSVAACRTDHDLSLHATAGALIATAERTVRGLTLPVEVRLIPQRDDDGWALVADSVSAGGISLPAARAAKLLAGRDGGTRLLEGIRLPRDERFALTSVSFRDGAAVVTASAAVGPANGGDSGGALSDLRSCLASGEDDR